MAENRKPLTIDEEDGSFVLRHQAVDGKESKLVLAEQDVINLGASALGLTKAVLSRRIPKSEGVNAMFAAPVAQFSVGPDSLGEDILLTLVTPNGIQTSFAISPSTGRLLREQLDKSIADIESSGLTRQ
jgi:hypothetical protein